MDHTKRFVNKYSKVATFPHVVTNLTDLINDPYSTMRQFEEIIEKDPVLVSRVLRLVNSAAFSLVHKVNSIGRAVAFLGMQNLHNLAVTDSLYSLFHQKQTPGGNFSPKALWQHSVAVAITGKTVSEKIFGIDGEKSYLCGLLHDFGLIVEFQVEPEKFMEVCNECHDSITLCNREKVFLKTDHTKIGEALALVWNMPKEIPHTIKKHHRHAGTPEPSSLQGILQISEHICNTLGHGVLPDYVSHIPPSLLEHMEENSMEYEVLMDELPEYFDALEALYP